MHLLTKIKLDGAGLPYWSTRLIHNDETIMEVVSHATFNPNNKQKAREAYESCTVRAIAEIGKSKDRETIMRMLIQD